MVLVAGTAVATLAIWSTRLTPVAAEPGVDLSSFMRKKLDASSMILEGLAVEDASLISKGSAMILEMSKVELWNVLTDSDYAEFNRDFRSTMRKLHQAADDKNFDNAMLQWIDAMKSCVECHKFVRDQRPTLKKP